MNNEKIVIFIIMIIIITIIVDKNQIKLKKSIKLTSPTSNYGQNVAHGP